MGTQVASVCTFKFSTSNGMTTARQVLKCALLPILAMGKVADFCCVASGRWPHLEHDRSAYCTACSTTHDAAPQSNWCSQSETNCGQCAGGSATWCSSSPVASPTNTTLTTATTTTLAVPEATTTTLATPHAHGSGTCIGPFLNGESFTGHLPAWGCTYENRHRCKSNGVLKCQADCDASSACSYYSYGDDDVYCWLYTECKHVTGSPGSGGYATYRKNRAAPQAHKNGQCVGP